GSIVSSIDDTARGFGRDADAYRGLTQPIASDWPRLERSVLGPPLALPRHPLTLARFGLHALRSADAIARGSFSTAAAQATFGGIAAPGRVRPRPLPPAGSR